MRLALSLLALLLAAPTASAAITIDEIELPERTMAGKPFPAIIELSNDGAARSIHLFAALYAPREGAGPCGPATDPRFKGFTHLLQETIRVPAQSTLRYPTSGDWLQRYDREDVGASPETFELCVFVANASATATIDYETFATTDIAVRGANALPTASFEWEPILPRATEDVRFEATGDDADGDPVSFSWDFGLVNASGRAVAEGPSPTTFFYPAGDYVVTLIASDGLEESRTTRTITVAEGLTAPPSDKRDPLGVPLAPWIAVAALVGAALAGALLARGRRRG